MKYKAVFFDWDGTAVVSRKAPVDDVIGPMKKLLGQGIKLAVISGTTIENIASGTLHKYFTVEERKNLFYGLGRGAYNYAFSDQGEPYLLSHMVPPKEQLLEIHKVCYEIHKYLYETYEFPTDIVFSRPNYCKIDLMVSNNRGDQLFFQSSELDVLKSSLEEHGFQDGLQGLIGIAERIGKEHGLDLSATTDAKYLEVGMSSKSNNVDTLLNYFSSNYDLEASQCTFWGDEYIGLDTGLYGSDSYMITEKTRSGSFYDVSKAEGIRPKEVQVLHGGVNRFISFLIDQGEIQV